MLTNKQRNYLRKLSHGLDAIYQIGKNGLGENTIKQFDDGLEARELIKAKVLNNSLFDAREACETIAEGTGAEVVSVIGNKFVLYRESKKKKTIELPKK
jgi:RNA-binding protein